MSIYRCWGYESLADIVVATPGRLVDHINTTTGFNLNQLRFMVWLKFIYKYIKHIANKKG